MKPWIGPSIRRRATGRASEIERLVSGLSYQKARIALPAYCLVLMQNLSEEDQRRLAESLAELSKMEAADGVKLRILATYLMNAMGPDALAAAIQSLDNEVKTGPS